MTALLRWLRATARVATASTGIRACPICRGSPAGARTTFWRSSPRIRLDPEEFGDAYCFVGIERNTKLVLNFTLGHRDQKTTDIFIEGLRDAISPKGHFQITTDGWHPYTTAITTTLGHRVDYAKLIKVYGAPRDGEARYSPATVESVEVVPVIGNSDAARICTSIVERQNLTMRMSIRRLTRLTNAFSKKFDNHWAMLCLYFAYYNFCRIHRSIRVTPAMAAGIADHVWSVEELLQG